MRPQLRIEVRGYVNETWEGSEKQSFRFLRELVKRKKSWMHMPGDYPLRVNVIHLKPTKNDLIS